MYIRGGHETVPNGFRRTVRALARPAGLVAAGLLVGLVVFAALAPKGEAQTASILVSNTGKDASGLESRLTARMRHVRKQTRWRPDGRDAHDWYTLGEAVVV